MAGWAELYDARLSTLPKQVFLCTGEISSLVWDKVHEALKGFDFHLRVESEADLSYSLTGVGAQSAYLMVDPDESLLKAAEKLIRSGATESLFILVQGEPAPEVKTTFEYVKKKAQQSKAYYTVTTPKAQQAKEKMISYFLMRWAVTRDTSTRVCSLLEFSPGQLYLFDQQFLRCTGGEVLASSKTQNLVSQLLGDDTPSMVVSKILDRSPVDREFGDEFTHKILMFLNTLLLHARLIHGAWDAGHSALNAVCKETGLSQFLALRAWGLAEAYSLEEIARAEELLLYAFEHEQGNPELLSVISRVWGR